MAIISTAHKSSLLIIIQQGLFARQVSLFLCQPDKNPVLLYRLYTQEHKDLLFSGFQSICLTDQIFCQGSEISLVPKNDHLFR